MAFNDLSIVASMLLAIGSEDGRCSEKRTTLNQLTRQLIKIQN